MSTISAWGGSWGDDDGIVVSSGSVLARLPASGGTPTPVTELAAGEVAHRWPQILPGSKALLFTVVTSLASTEGASIEAVSLKDRRRKSISDEFAYV